MRSAQQKRGKDQKQAELLSTAPSRNRLNLLKIDLESKVAEARLFNGFAHLEVFESSMPQSRFHLPYPLTNTLETNGIQASGRGVNMFEKQLFSLEAPRGMKGEVESRDHSLIDDLIRLQDETGTLFYQHQHKDPLQQLQAVSSKSFQQQDSYNFQENQSELAELTLEEKEFFNNFTCSKPQRDTKQQISILTGIDLLAFLKQKDERTVGRVMEEKRRIIRNFFRPKDCLIKDEKTCCSGTFLDELVLQSNRSLKKTLFEDELQSIEDRVCAM